MTAAVMGGVAYVNGVAADRAELRVERDVQTGWTRGPRADTAWTFTDESGHFHAYDRAVDGADHYPTLTAKHRQMPCDGSCGGVCGGEGYTITEYFCRICGVQVEPGLTHGDQPFSLPGQWSWSVTTYGTTAGWDHAGELVSVRFETPSAVRFGVAKQTSWEQTGETVRVELIGISPLGQTVVKTPAAVSS